MAEHERPLVLVVEDEEPMRNLIGTALRRRYRVEMAKDGLAGLNRAVELGPDLILSDVFMPGFDGEQLYKRVRATAGLEDVPFILISGAADEQVRIRLLRQGAQDFLMKPFAVNELMARVENHISIRRVRQLLQGELASREQDIQVLAAELAERSHGLERARAELERLNRRLVEVQEAERAHLARELHDEIGQQLTALKITLDLIDRGAGAGTLGSAGDQLNELIGRIRQMSLDLRPPELDNLGLVPALLAQIERYTSRTAVQVEFHHTGLPAWLPEETATAAFRIIQESLTNVARHATVDRAGVRLAVEDGVLQLRIRDRGAGFRPDAAAGTAGLVGMRERAHLLGGRLWIESDVGQGTLVCADLPLPGGKP